MVSGSVLRRLPNPSGQGRKLVERIRVARVQPRTSKGITDLLLPGEALRAGCSGHQSTAAAGLAAGFRRHYGSGALHPRSRCVLAVAFLHKLPRSRVLQATLSGELGRNPHLGIDVFAKEQLAPRHSEGSEPSKLETPASESCIPDPSRSLSCAPWPTSRRHCSGLIHTHDAVAMRQPPKAGEPMTRQTSSRRPVRILAWLPVRPSGRLRGRVSAWFPGCLAFWLLSCLAVLSSCLAVSRLAVCLSGCLAVIQWSHCLTVVLPGHDFVCSFLCFFFFVIIIFIISPSDWLAAV